MRLCSARLGFHMHLIAWTFVQTSLACALGAQLPPTRHHTRLEAHGQLGPQVRRRHMTVLRSATLGLLDLLGTQGKVTEQGQQFLSQRSRRQHSVSSCKHLQAWRSSLAKLCLVGLLTLKAGQVLLALVTLAFGSGCSARSLGHGLRAHNKRAISGFATVPLLTVLESSAREELHCKQGLFALRASTWLVTQSHFRGSHAKQRASVPQTGAMGARTTSLCKAWHSQGLSKCLQQAPDPGGWLLALAFHRDWTWPLKTRGWTRYLHISKTLETYPVSLLRHVELQLAEARLGKTLPWQQYASMHTSRSKQS